MQEKIAKPLRFLVTGGTLESRVEWCARMLDLGYDTTTDQEDDFDVALMDLRSCYSATALGLGASARDRPVIGVIDHGTAGDLRRLLAAGVGAFVQPSFDGAEFTAVLGRMDLTRRETGTPLAAVGDDPDVLAEHLIRLRAHGPDLVAEIEAALARKDGLSMTSAAWRLRRFVEVFGPSRALNTTARVCEGVGDGVNGLADELSELIATVMEIAANDGEAPMRESHATILLIEDDALMRTIVGSIVRRLGHECREAPTGRDGLTLALTESPQLIVLDRMLPDMDGLEVLEELGSHLMTNSIPVILLTARGAAADRVAGLRAGADDYVVKPFKPVELAARIETTLRRSSRDLATDPLTKLPGNAALRHELKKRLRSKKPVAVVYADLNEFKAYVDYYGFERASAAILRVAQLLYNTLVEAGEPDDFLGHIGGDDFLLLAPPDRAEALCGRVLEAFCHVAPTLYDDQDRARGYIEGHDRYGVERRFHLMSMVLAIIEITPGEDPDLEEVGEFAATCKKKLKLQGGNTMAQFVFEGVES
ncbi:MAG: response regulator [Planctomycetota bacterium]|nr:response regulator [Planctomycetota bacterium]